MNTIDGLVFEKLDVYRRLTMAFGDAEERFWNHLGKTLGLIVKEVVGAELRESFSTTNFSDDGAWCAYRKEWVLDCGSAGEELAEWNRASSFWFPAEQTVEWDIFALMGLGDDEVMYAAIWGQPLSLYTGDLESARKLWDKIIAAPLRSKGWESYGQRVTKPTGDWGMRIPIRLDHREIAKAMESGDLRPALIPLENAVEDFGSVCAAMDDVVKNLRAAKGRSNRKI
jgi:hypothetical protein